MEVAKRAPPSLTVAGGLGFNTVVRATWEADQGRTAEAQATLALSYDQLLKFLATVPKESFQARSATAEGPRFDALVRWAGGDYAGARDSARKAIAQVTALKTSTQGGARLRAGYLADSNSVLAEALFGLKDYGAAEAAAREAVRLRMEGPRRSRQNQLEVASDQTLLALILARQGKLAEARTANEPALAFHRTLLARGSEDVDQHVALATALYAAALASPAVAPGLLNEGKRMLDALPPQTLKRRSVSRVRDWIAVEMKRG